MTVLLAYHNDPKVRAKYLRRVRAHPKQMRLCNPTATGEWQGLRGGLHAAQ